MKLTTETIIITLLLISTCQGLPLGWKPIPMLFKKLQTISSIFTIAKTISSLSSLSSQLTQTSQRLTGGSNTPVNISYDVETTTATSFSSYGDTSAPEGYPPSIAQLNKSNEGTLTEIEPAQIAEYGSYLGTVEDKGYLPPTSIYNNVGINQETSFEIQPSRYSEYVSPSAIDLPQDGYTNANRVLDQDLIKRIREIVLNDETSLNRGTQNGNVLGVSLDTPVSSVNFASQTDHTYKRENPRQNYGYYRI